MSRDTTSRRHFLKTIAAGTALAATPVLSHAAKTEQPNVLFIAIDDLNDWVSCLGGHPDARTPNIDRVAARGVNFTNAYCSAPACNPSRASLMTGWLPSESGVYINPQPWRPQLPDVATIPQHFMAHGYRAIGRGKIYHGAFPDDASWDEYIPKGKDVSPKINEKRGVGKVGGLNYGPTENGDADMDDCLVAEWAVEQLGKKHDKPFFLAVGFYRPHLPWFAPQKYFDMFPPDKITLPVVKKDDLNDVPPVGKGMAKPGGDHTNVTKSGKWRELVSAYLACGAFTDAQVGRVFDALEQSDYNDNTVVVLWSDHGWHLGEKLHWRKFALWEEATHNLMMIAAPGLTQPNGRCEQPVSHIDLYPTLIDLCGLKPKPELFGQSLRPFLKDPSATWDRPALTTHGRQNHTLRTAKWRYIRYNDGTEELYDKQADEMEWTNLADQPEHASVKKRLAKWLPTTNVPEAPRMSKKAIEAKKKAKREARSE